MPLKMKTRKGTPEKTGSVRKAFNKEILTSKEIDDELNRMEADIRMFKIEFEQYFGGGRSRPPSDTEWRIEQTAKRYGDRGADLNYGQRFRFGGLSQAFAKYKEMFGKRMRQREEGRVDRHYGVGEAARAIESKRVQSPAPLPGGPPAPEPVAVSCSDPANEPRKVEQIYNAFRQALEHSGQPVDKLSPRAFEDFLRRKVEQLRKQKGEQEVEVVVSVEDGKPILKARIKS